jgi:plastocyanin
VVSAFVAALLCAAPTGAATVNVIVQNNVFSPNDLTINQGDTVHWINNLGPHTVTADDGSFDNGAVNQPWTYDRTFNTPGEVRYYCAVHSQPGLNIQQNMNGRIIVLATEPPPPTFNINQGMAGVWYNPQTGGQGFLFEVRPSDKFMFVAWFTFDKAAPAGAIGSKLGATEQRWFTIQGSYNADRTINAKIFSTSGGQFNTVKQVTNTQVGTATIVFTSCTAGSVTYDIPGDNLTGTINIIRAIPGTENICQALASQNP